MNLSPDTAEPRKDKAMLNKTVAEILSSDVVSIDQSAPAINVVRKMREHRVSCVVIMDDQSPVGIFTEHNLLWSVAQGIDMTKSPVKLNMSFPVYSQKSATTVLDAYDHMRRMNIRHLVILDDNQNVMGVITLTNLIKSLMEGGLDQETTVADFFNPQVITAPLDGMVRDYFRVMAEQQISCLVIVHDSSQMPQKASHVAAGILTERDCVRIVHDALPDLDHLKLFQVMSSPVQAVCKDEPLQLALEKMSAQDLRRLVVLDPCGQVAGILTQSDIARGLGSRYMATLSSLLAKARQKEQKYRGLFENALEGIFQVSFDGEVISVNPALAGMHGYESPEDFTKSITGPVSELFVDKNVFRDFFRILREEEKVFNFEAMLWKKDGSWFWGSVSAHQVWEDGQNLIEGYVEDCTERKQAVEEIQNARTLAESSSRLRDELLQLINNGVRTPLMSILGACDMFPGYPTNRQEDMIFHMARHACQSLTLVLNDVMDLIGFEDKTFVLENNFFSLYEVTENVVQHAGLTARERDCILKSEIDPDINSLVKGDANRLSQVLSTLLNGMIQQSYDGTVSLSLKMEEQSGVYTFTLHSDSVSLSGSASDMDGHLPYRPGASPLPSVHNGLGLPICERIIRAMGGSIHTLQGKNADLTYVFSVRLESSLVETGLAVFREKMQGIKALVVDDVYAHRFVLCENLTNLGVDFLEADSMDKAFSCWEEVCTSRNNFDLILIPARMASDFSQKITRQSLKALTRDQDFLPGIIVICDSKGSQGHFPGVFNDAYVILKQPFSLSHLSDSLVRALNLKIGPVVIPTSTCPPGHLRVLLADVPASRQVMKYYLEQCGCEVHVVGNGLEAFEAFASGRFDLVLLEIRLAGLSGIEAAELMREYEQEKGQQPARIVGVCAHLPAAQKEAALNAGIEAVLIKPFEKKQLIRVINELFAYDV